MRSGSVPVGGSASSPGLMEMSSATTSSLADLASVCMSLLPDYRLHGPLAAGPFRYDEGQAEPAEEQAQHARDDRCLNDARDGAVADVSGVHRQRQGRGDQDDQQEEA